MKGYKGFDRDLKCRGFQYEIGKTFTHQGEVSLCNSGLHFCENALRVLDFYDPTQRFAEVEAEDVVTETASDSKRVAKTIHIKDEISLSSLIQCGVKFILDKVDFANAKESNTGDNSAATNTGYSSAATNTGNSSAATNTGKDGTAISIGIEGRASGSIGNFLVLAEWEFKNSVWKRIAMGLAKVDGKKIKADTFYVLKNGKFIEYV